MTGPKKKQNAESVLRSLFGLIAIRGTRVFAGPSNGVFGVFVDRGSVDVTAAGKTVTLAAGSGPTSPTPAIRRPTRPLETPAHHHMPGVEPRVIREQIALLGAEVVPRLSR